MTFKVSEPSAEHLRALTSELGAVLTGRRTFEVAHGWGGNHAWGPAFVLTHHIPDGWPRPDSTVHFVTDGVESAVCLNAGLLDEIHVDIAAVLSAPEFDSSTTSPARQPSSATRRSFRVSALRTSATRCARRSPTENIDRADALFFGRVTYEMMEAAFRAPARTGVRPDWMEPWMEPFARTIDAAKKYVVSSTLTQVDWNAELVRGGLADAVRQLKREPGKEILVTVTALRANRNEITLAALPRGGSPPA
jgi:dihydrofolate reductase